ncbi:MAG: thioredoxin family protein [Synechococcaceae cyanobacterium]|nr:thioredoxin family protein [Synechococcaceae cyanobacterium]
MAVHHRRLARPTAMALTPSTMLPLDTPLPREALLRRLRPVSGPALETVLAPERPLLVLFLCPHCPFVKHIEAEIRRLQEDWGDQAAIVAICSNSTRTHPQDGPEGMAEQARRNGWTFPYLQDPDQTVARAFQAACTPDPFLFDATGRLAYRGQLDPSRPGNDLASDGRDLRAAMEALLAGARPSPEQTPAIGCNIKWHPQT